jgi:uncharacterized protein (TIGR03382 family)
VRAAIVLSLILVVPTVASADWEPADIEGFLRYVDVWRPGVYSVMTGTRVEFWDNGNLAEEFPLLGDVYGTFLSPDGCYAGVRQSGAVFSANNCWQPGNIIPPEPTGSGGAVRRVRFTPSGTGYAMVQLEPTEHRFLTSSPAEVRNPPWAPMSVPSKYLSTEVMGVTDTADGAPHAIFHVVGGPPVQFLWFREDRQQAAVAIDANLTRALPRTVDLIAANGPDPIALFGNENGLFRGQLTPSSTSIMPFSHVDAGTPVSIAAVDVNTGNGSMHGEGYGLAVGTDADGGSVILQAVPADSAANAGTRWRVHPTLNAGKTVLQSTTPIAVQCVGSAFCVIGLNRPPNAAGNHILYSNLASPVVRVDAGMLPVEVNEEGTTTLELVASDGDDDPVRISLDGGTVLNLLAVTSTAEPDSLTVTLRSISEICKDETRRLDVFASDGLRAHDLVDAGVSVTIKNTRGPGAPSVSPMNPVTSASETPFDLNASQGAGPCVPVGYQWESVSSDPLVLANDGGVTATFVPPTELCQPTPRSYTYTVRGRDEGGLWSAPTRFTVTVRPWGRPLAPFGPSASRSLFSGPDAGVELVPEELHDCDTATERPTVKTVWRLSTPEAGIPTGLTVKDTAGNTVSLGEPVESEKLRVEADECTRASLSLTAHNRIPDNDAEVQAGPEATVRVDVAPPVEDFATVQLNLEAAHTGNGQVDVTLGTSLRCPNAYSLKAQLSVKDAATGQTVAEALVDASGSWRSPPREVCSAAEYVIEGQLFDEARTPGDTSRTSVSVPERAVELGALEGGALTARCGEGATATLTQMQPPDACRAVNFSWTRLDGPLLAEAALSGERVTVATRDLGLEELVGETLRLQVTANAGGNESATVVHTLPITTEPFVDLRHETESPTGSEKGLVGVVVRLRNTSDCRVGSLRHVERLDGMDLVPGSVKVDGQPVVEQAVEGGFAVEDVPLEAGGTTTLTYVARPRLLTSPRFGAEVFLKGVPVSGSIPVAPTSGCGCSGGGSGAAVFGLLALARLLRRRRDGSGPLRDGTSSTAR